MGNNKRSKIIDNLINDFKELSWKKILYITFFFILIYISTDFLNSIHLDFDKVFNTSFIDAIMHLGEINYYLFKFPKFICTILIYIFSYFILYGLTNKNKFSCLMISTVSFVFSIINYIITQIRGISLTLSDIFSFQTAMNVSKGVTATFEENFVVGILFFLIAITWLFKFDKFDEPKKEHSRKERCYFIAIGIVGILFFYTFNPLMNSVRIWDINKSYMESGATLTTMKMLKDLDVEEPDGYDKNKVIEILNKFSGDAINLSGDFPNIIIVMNESFADLGKIYNLEMSGDCVPYFHSFLSGENVISGTMHSSEYGGGTANIEYELLTQNSVAFLPVGSIPYQQYITSDVKTSLPAYFNNLSYNSYGIHSWNKSGYSRPKIYKYLNFKNVLFREDMKDLEYSFNNYSTDISTYKYLFDILENKSGDEKVFTFLLTMQNHLPYNNLNSGEKEFVSGDEALNSYLQSLKMSDDALEELINYIENYNEKTILLFFGDHQPSLKLDEKYGVKEEYSGDSSKHLVPFFIWANYDIEERKQIETSTIYFQSLLFEVADLPLNQYMKYIKGLRNDIPIITRNYYITKDGDKYIYEDDSSPYYEKIKEYENVVYYQMFED